MKTFKIWLPSIFLFGSVLLYLGGVADQLPELIIWAWGLSVIGVYLWSEIKDRRAVKQHRYKTAYDNGYNDATAYYDTLAHLRDHPAAERD